jgi:hypothetical protein
MTAAVAERLVGRIAEGLMRDETRCLEAAAERLLLTIGVEGVRSRATREVEDNGELHERVVRLLVDGVPVWEGRRAWLSLRLKTRWLVDPETLAP